MHLILPAVAISINITVDDTFGNPDRTVIPEYLPAGGAWHAGSPSEQCDICEIKPSMLDMGQIVNQSWHHGLYYIGIPIQIQVSFPGTAVYVYNVVPNTLPNGGVTVANISFSLDGETVGNFFHPPDASSEFLYHQLVYANASLPDGLHTLVMSASGRKQSLMFFDYLVYSTHVERETSPTTAVTSGASSPATYLMPPASSSATVTPATSSAHAPTAKIVGGVVGGVALLLVGLAFFLFFFTFVSRRHRFPQRRPNPFTEQRPDCIPPKTTPSSITTSASERIVRPLSTGLSSNAATYIVSGPSLGLSPSLAIASPSNSSSSTLDLKREAEVRRRIDIDLEAVHRDREMAAMSSPLAQHSQQRSHAGTSERLNPGMVQELQGEISALRDVLSAVNVVVHAGFHQLPDMSEVLPGYEEARGPSDLPRNVGYG